MCLLKDFDKKTFEGVALAFIVLGAALFAYGLIAWIYNLAAEQTVLVFPSIKVIGGAVIMLLAYIVLELELLRKK